MMSSLCVRQPSSYFFTHKWIEGWNLGVSLLCLLALSVCLCIHISCLVAANRTGKVW
jgi:hypothetical protein